MDRAFVSRRKYPGYLPTILQALECLERVPLRPSCASHCPACTLFSAHTSLTDHTIQACSAYFATLPHSLPHTLGRQLMSGPKRAHCRHLDALLSQEHRQLQDDFVPTLIKSVPTVQCPHGRYTPERGMTSSVAQADTAAPTTLCTASTTCSGCTMVAASSSYAYAVGTSCELSLTTCTSRSAEREHVMQLHFCIAA